MALESSFQTKVIKWLKVKGCYAPKFNASAISKAGVPDVPSSIRGIYVGIELKRDDKSKATELQKFNIKEIDRSGGVGIVLRPSTFTRFTEIVMEFFDKELTTCTDVEEFKKCLKSEIGDDMKEKERG